MEELIVSDSIRSWIANSLASRLIDKDVKSGVQSRRKVAVSGKTLHSVRYRREQQDRSTKDLNLVRLCRSSSMTCAPSRAGSVRDDKGLDEWMSALRTQGSGTGVKDAGRSSKS